MIKITKNYIEFVLENPASDFNNVTVSTTGRIYLSKVASMSVELNITPEQLHAALWKAHTEGFI